MRSKLAIALALSIGLLVTAGGFNAATAASSYFYGAAAGGTQVKALGTTITSDLTSQSSITGAAVPNSDTNNVASVTAGTLADVGAVRTSTKSAAIAGGFSVTAREQTAGVNILNGLITADAVTSTHTLRQSAGTLSSSATTNFVNLVVAGKPIDVNVAKNTAINIPGVAMVVLNSQNSAQNSGAISSVATGLHVRLLAPYREAPTASEITLNPSFLSIQEGAPSDTKNVGGIAYSSFVDAQVGPGLKAQAGRSALLNLPLAGTRGETIKNSTAAVYLANILNLGGLESTGTATGSSALTEARTTSELGRVNLFNGLIRADAILASSDSRKVGVAPATTELQTHLVNLKIAGKPIPVDVAPNTSINVANLGVVTLNKQVDAGHAGIVTALEIKLSTARAGLPIGAVVQIGYASSIIWGG